jgi:hypothetical protein
LQGESGRQQGYIGQLDDGFRSRSISGCSAKEPGLSGKVFPSLECAFPGSWA